MFSHEGPTTSSFQRSCPVALAGTAFWSAGGALLEILRLGPHKLSSGGEQMVGQVDSDG